MCVALLLGCRSEPPSTAPPPIPAADAPAPEFWFEELGGETGVDFRHESGARGRFDYPESMGSGIAICDVDQDGLLDLYFVQSGGLTESAEPETASSRPTNKLYRNLGGFRFEDVTRLSNTGDPGYGMGVACADYDNDGDVDLYVTNVGANTLLRNRGDGTFEDVTAAAGAADEGWGTSASFFDGDRDGDLDLVLVNYLSWSVDSEHPCIGSKGQREYCGPLQYRAPQPDVLFENRGDGTFERSDSLRSAFGNGLGVVAADFDRDGRSEIYVANDQVENQYWVLDGESWRDSALLRGVAVNRRGTPEAGMGVAAVDVENDGDLDLFVTHLEGESNTLYENLTGDGQPGLFRDATAQSGLEAPSLPATGFGLGFYDFDQDGLVDLYVANGRVTRSARPATSDPYAEVDQLFRGVSPGRFEPVAQAQRRVETGRGAAFGDLDNDGDIDVVVANRDAAPSLLRNVAGQGNWLLVRAVSASGSDALGAVISLEVGGDRMQYGHVQTDGSYLSSNDPRVHFGLGRAGEVDHLEVRWPGGEREAFGSFRANQLLVVREGRGQPLNSPRD